jgi:energy-coupling factor transporter ATP-binding protein EcfA2
MRLLGLEVWNWRGLDHANLPDLAADLNLVVGPNESGKSRMFESLRFALFERYKGESEEKRRLRSWGGSESPEVEVRFEARGRAFMVRKRFLKGARTQLVGAGSTWVDDEAEAELRRLWGTREIKGRKGGTDQFLGLWPLLWVEQGKAGLAPHHALNEDSKGRLRDSLAVEVNEVATGPRGQRVLARAEEERDRYWTATWKETGELAQTRARHAVAEAALAEQLARRDRARSAAEDLARVEEQLKARKSQLETQRAATESARARARIASERAIALGKLELEASALHARCDLARAALAKRADVSTEASRLAAEIVTLGETLHALLAKQQISADEERSARLAVEQAQRAEEAARAAHGQAARRARHGEARRQVFRAGEQLQAARAQIERVARIDHELLAIRVTPSKMKALRKAQEAFVLANARLSAAAARVRVRALKDLVLDGKLLPSGEERGRELDEPTTMILEGVAEIHVWPAGAELQKLRDEERDARQLLDARLDDVGITSVTEAEEQLRRRIELDAERAQCKTRLLEVAPNGSELLEQELAAAEVELGALGNIEEVGASTVELEEELARVLDALARARAERDRVGATLAQASEQAAIKRHALSDAESRRAAAVDKLSGMAPSDLLAQKMAETEAEWKRAEELRRLEADALRRDGAFDAALDLEREEKALASLERLERENKDERIALDERVRHAGGEGIHEAVQEAEGVLAELASELARVVRRAEAARTLVSALSEARREVQERLVAPVREKIGPYLNALLPGAELDMDDEWRLRGLHAKNQEEAFDSLSFGAQEQIGLLVRLGLAEVLGQGESLPIVLDDCLVNTDAERQKEMLRILYRASKKQQIVLFSCHDVAFERLGATRRYELPARRAR